MPYLSKSRFKQALNCPTKLYYGTKGNNYADNNADDPFIMALAEGGYQVGELAKFLVSNDPVGENITINELDYEKSLAQTKEKREKGGKIVIAEAAFAYKDFFVRTDLFVEERDTIKLYEVKAKSWDEKVEFLIEINDGPLMGTKKIEKKWSEYLYDIAFQKYVVQKANPQKTVITYIVLADKTKNATIEGLNQLFKIKRNGKNIDVEVKPGTTKASLGQIPLKTINVDDVCDWIYSNKVDIDLENPNAKDWSFETLINYLSEQYSKNKRIWSTKVGSKCKACQYKNKEHPLGEKKSGLHECW
jgi:hypothetical protein